MVRDLVCGARARHPQEVRVARRGIEAERRQAGGDASALREDRVADPAKLGPEVAKHGNRRRLDGRGHVERLAHLVDLAHELLGADEPTYAERREADLRERAHDHDVGMGQQGELRARRVVDVGLVDDDERLGSGLDDGL